VKAGKIHEHEGGIDEPEAIFTYVHDIVGTRVTCNTKDDVNAVVAAIQSVVESNDGHKVFSRGRDDWKKDYVSGPKESGYRAVNLTLAVYVPQGGHLSLIPCEVQVRTLLQHAWGELTHEDTYKPGVSPPPLVVTLSRRLADALAVLDDIALDLRKELDRVEALSVAESAPTLIAPPAPVEGQSQGGAIATISGKKVDPGETADEDAEGDDAESSEHIDAKSAEASKRSTAPALSVGDHVMGTVMSSGPQYALIQIAEGRRGILHYSALKSSWGDYVDVSDKVAVGDTVEVTITSVDHGTGRVELSLVEPDVSPRPRRREPRW
jgi:predicted RNA-binding protein with RPS1 domain